MQGCVSQVRREKGFQAPQADTQRNETEALLEGPGQGMRGRGQSGRQKPDVPSSLQGLGLQLPVTGRVLSLGVVWSHLVILTDDSGSQRRMDLRAEDRKAERSVRRLKEDGRKKIFCKESYTELRAQSAEACFAHDSDNGTLGPAACLSAAGFLQGVGGN